MLLLASGWPQTAVGQSDDFNDGDDAGWVRFGLDSAGPPFTPAAYSFPPDDFGGSAYRISVAAPPVPDAGPARAFSYRTNTYDNFYAAVDVLTWDNTLNQAFGFLVRASGIGLGQTDGYVLNYDPNQASGGRGQFQINTVTDEEPITLVAANISLDPARRYRFVLTGLGTTQIGQIYDFSDLTTPLVSIQADDQTYPSGVLGLFDFSRVNLAEYTNPITGKADVTLDNYYASGGVPAAVDPPATPHPVPGIPQVAGRSPASWANFYSFTNGVSFTATTLTTNAVNTNAAKLYLNGADVSAGLAFSGSASNAAVTFEGLSANTVYDARIVLSDFAGRSTTNEFTFDTFDESYFDSPGVKVIEAEDYNYEGGKFQDNPPPAGLNSAGTQVNGGGAGYYDLSGSPGIDYFDFSASPGSGAAAEYRTTDLVGTQAGSIEIDNAGPLNDTQRQKFAALDLPEYEVRGTEGGEWLNYTRVFSNASYHVYLREACRAAQTVYLDQVTGDPTQPGQATARLGVFNVSSTAMLIHYRFVRLTDTNGNLAVVNLSGTNTLRLTLGGPQTDATKYTMALNYLVLVPVTEPRFILQASFDPAGPYTDESNAVYETNSFTATTPRNGAARFYRVRTTSQSPSNWIRVATVQVSGNDVVITAGFLR